MGVPHLRAQSARRPRQAAPRRSRRIRSGCAAGRPRGVRRGLRCRLRDRTRAARPRRVGRGGVVVGGGGRWRVPGRRNAWRRLPLPRLLAPRAAVARALRMPRLATLCGRRGGRLPSGMRAARMAPRTAGARPAVRVAQPAAHARLRRLPLGRRALWRAARQRRRAVQVQALPRVRAPQQGAAAGGLPRSRGGRDR
eukprot:7388868-Prymnesium_polylepis.2